MPTAVGCNARHLNLGALRESVINIIIADYVSMSSILDVHANFIGYLEFGSPVFHMLSMDSFCLHNNVISQVILDPHIVYHACTLYRTAVNINTRDNIVNKAFYTTLGVEFKVYTFGVIEWSTIFSNFSHPYTISKTALLIPIQHVG